MQVLSMAFGTYSSSACQTCGCSEESCESCQTVTDCSNCASCCCSATHQLWRHGRIGSAIRVEYFSSFWMTIEVLGAIRVGLTAGSFALLAFGGDSLIELITGLVVLRSLRPDSSNVGGVNDNNRTERFTSALLFPLIPAIRFSAVYSYATLLLPERSPPWDPNC